MSKKCETPNGSKKTTRLRFALTFAGGGVFRSHFVPSGEWTSERQQIDVSKGDWLGMREQMLSGKNVLA